MLPDEQHHGLRLQRNITQCHKNEVSTTIWGKENPIIEEILDSKKCYLDRSTSLAETVKFNVLRVSRCSRRSLLHAVCHLVGATRTALDSMLCGSYSLLHLGKKAVSTCLLQHETTRASFTVVVVHTTIKNARNL